MSAGRAGMQATDFKAVGRELDELVIRVRGMTCQSCATRVGNALDAVPGVVSATVDLRAGRAAVRVDTAMVTPESLRDAVEAAGYLAENPVAASGGAASQERTAVAFRTPGYASIRSVTAGVLASVILVGFYFLVMSVAQGTGAAISLLQEDWYLITPLVLGFGVQVALFWRTREISVGVAGKSAKTVTGASGGISGLSMLACCAHHLADLLPIVGLAGLAALLGEFRQPLMVAGIASNLVGILFMGRVISRSRQLV